MKFTSVSMSVIATIAYTFSLGITGTWTSPLSYTGQPSDLVCHQDIETDQFESQCGGESSSARFFYDSSNDTCIMTYTCSSWGTNVTHASFEDCMTVCSNENSTDNLNLTCSHPGELLYGTVHLSECQGTSCTRVFYSCNHDSGFELFPEEHRSNSFDCKSGIWEEHNVYCAKADVSVSVNGLKAEDYSSLTVEIGQDLVLSCDVAGGMPYNSYNVSWRLATLDGQKTVLNHELNLNSITENQEGIYTCIVTGSVNKEIKTDLKVVLPKNVLKPEILRGLAQKKADKLYAACLCKGRPKPTSWWMVDNISYSQVIPVLKQDEILNIVHLPFNPNISVVYCHCENEYGSTVSEIDILGRKKRDTHEDDITADYLKQFCEQHYNSVIVTGQVLRQIKSSSTHIKVQSIDYTKLQNSLKSVRKGDILRAQSKGIQIRRNHKYIFKLERKENDYAITATLPYKAGINTSINSLCN